ncbi:MAG: HD domain-containing protein [Gemmatimonadaceae bacterium]|jgi:putative nucleotidyltransferase with HDIG domain|nr:HD domain-containing protein [Gemmatimonadaceae bacterium]
MTAPMGFLATRVGRRLLASFLGAALLPVLAVSAVGYWTVRASLVDESQERVLRLAKSASLTLLGAIAAESHIGVRDDRGGVVRFDDLAPDARAHLRAGAPLLVVDDASHPSGDAELRFVRRSADERTYATTLDASRLWVSLSEVVQGERATYCVFTVRSRTRIRCSDDASAETVERMRAWLRTSAGAQSAAFTPELVFGHRELFLRFEYGAESWHLVTAEATDEVFAPLRGLSRTLALLVALAVVAAFMLAHRQIRRSTAPLVQLHDGTARVAAGDFSTPVHIPRGDEYADLGDAFNGMTTALSRQVALLGHMDAIDEAALRDRERRALVQAALGHFCAIGTHSRVSIALVGDEPDTLEISWIDPKVPHLQREQRTVSAAERTMLNAAGRVQQLDARAGAHPAVGWGPTMGVEHTHVVLPLVHDAELLGVVTLTQGDSVSMADDDVAAARRLADRLAMGVANTLLMERLDALSLGALRAFANAIDANSPWTAGHTDRVTTLALALGERLGLATPELQTLQRGALLHDIGKIGVPASILDKAGPLTAEERAIVERHPVIGEQILRPLPVFASVLSIVRSHHERVDGTGYPDRLIGEEIPWLARVLSVADVYDALTSDRPYRRGLSVEQTLAIIVADAGRAFEPRVVDALLAIAADHALPARPTRGVSAAEVVAPPDLVLT